MKKIIQYLIYLLSYSLGIFLVDKIQEPFWLDVSLNIAGSLIIILTFRHHYESN